MNFVETTLKPVLAFFFVLTYALMFTFTLFQATTPRKIHLLIVSALILLAYAVNPKDTPTSLFLIAYFYLAVQLCIKYAKSWKWKALLLAVFFLSVLCHFQPWHAALNVAILTVLVDPYLYRGIQRNVATK